MSTLILQLDLKSGVSEQRSFRASRLIIAGWAGRDSAAVQHHIDELAAIGIAPPSQTPLFYAASASLLTQAPSVEMLDDTSSGEAEPWLLNAADGFLIGIGSDHTDRKAEAWSVPHSKQLCAKPVASTVWRFDEVVDHWDSLILRSWVPGEAGNWVLYQEGSVAALRRPDELVALAGGIPLDATMLCGTLPAIGGVRPAAGFRMQLHDPVLQRSIEHDYTVTTLPVVV